MKTGFFKLAAVTLAATLLLAGCGKNNATSSTSASGTAVSPTLVADKMMEVFTPQGEMPMLEDSVIDNFYTIDKELITGYKVYASSSYIAEEIAVFATVDQKGMDAAKKMLEERLAKLKSDFDGYLPEELASLEENAKILENGSLICLLTGEGEGLAKAEAVFKDAQNLK